MMPLMHIAFGLLLTLAAYFCFKPGSYALIVLFLSSWVFDLEFPLRYVARNFGKIKQQGIVRIYNYYVEKRKRLVRMPASQRRQILLSSNRILIFHTIEFIALLSIALFFILKHYNGLIYLWCFLSGIALHLLLDILDRASIKEKFSIILFYLAKRKQKNKIAK